MRRSRLAQPQGKIFPIIGEMWRIIRIAEQVRAPAALHRGVFAREAPRLRGREIAAAADRLMMNQLREWRPNIKVAGGADPQAEIDIVERNGQALVEAVDLIEHLPADQQTGCCHRTDVLHYAKAAQIAQVVRAREAVPVSRNAAEADHDAGVLDAPVG